MTVSLKVCFYVPCSKSCFTGQIYIMPFDLLTPTSTIFYFTITYNRSNLLSATWPFLTGTFIFIKVPGQGSTGQQVKYTIVDLDLWPVLRITETNLKILDTVQKIWKQKLANKYIFLLTAHKKKIILKERRKNYERRNVGCYNSDSQRAPGLCY